MQVVDVLTYLFSDSVAATLHFAVAGVVSGANGLVATSAPTILSTTNVQNVDSPTITEPVKDFFKSGDVVTFTIRDANGSSNTIGLAGAPLVAGGSMRVGVASGGGAAGAQSGSCQFGNRLGASTSVVFKGKSVTWYAVTWYAVTGPTQGNASVVLDDLLKVTVNHYATTLHDGVTQVHSVATSGNHTLRIVMIGF